MEGSSGTVSSSIVPFALGLEEAKRSGAELSPAVPEDDTAAEGEEEEEASFSWAPSATDFGLSFRPCRDFRLLVCGVPIGLDSDF